ncbi:hypothetical protein GCM10027589_06460 [Actinocorallia lasiicapitis]
MPSRGLSLGEAWFPACGEIRVLALAPSRTPSIYVLAGTTPVLVHNCDPLVDYANTVRNKPGVKFASEYTSPSGGRTMAIIVMVKLPRARWQMPSKKLVITEVVRRPIA